MKNENVNRLIPAVLAVVLAAQGAGCRDKEKVSAPAKGAESVEKESADRVELDAEALEHLHLGYARAERRRLDPSLVVSGELVPIADLRAEVGPLIAGRVALVRVNVGDKVRKGEPLLAVDSPEAGKARARHAAAAAALKAAQPAYERAKALSESGGFSRRELQEAERAFHTAQAELAEARALLGTLGLDENTPGVSGNATRVWLKSPIAGTVVARDVSVGRSVEPSRTLLTMVNLDELWLMADVYERDMRFVAAGQDVDTEVRAYPGELFRGRIARVGDILDEKNRSVKVRATIPNPGHRLKPGMFATARIQGAHAHEEMDMLAVPWSAIQEVDDHRAVFVRAKDGAFELKKIHTGERAGELVEVLNGLSEGETVVTEGSFLLKGHLLRSTLGEEE